VRERGAVFIACSPTLNATVDQLSGLRQALVLCRFCPTCLERHWHRHCVMTTQSQTQSQTGDGRLYDLDQVRRDAKSSILKGAVTADYPLDLARTYELMNEALAAEILCVLRYRHHQIIAKGIDFPQVAAQFAEHAEDEHRHMMSIAERIDQLGGNPDFNPATVTTRASTEYGSSDVLARMIEEDLVAERVVIEIYRRVIGWFGNADPTSRRLFEDILKDEEDHANDMSDLLAAIDPRSEPQT
jgi:bacterioferritin